MINETSPTTDAMRGYRYKHGDRPLDGYTIQRAAGRGGFGEVYYAISDSGREVALKVVHTFEQMELRGISQCMNLKSPHLVSIFDVRTGQEGQPIVIMEFVSGPSLRELLDEAPSGLGTQKAAFFLREIGKGLTYLHDCGIVHRDLKPANIFYENGCVKIGDYGLSKAISSSHRSGQTMTVGTVHYMAPEIGAGKYDRSIDIYALGILLFEMLTGHPPFYGASTAEVLMKHLGTQVDLSGVTEPFATVIRKALSKNPDDRYETTQQMVEAVFGAEHIRQSVSCFSPDHLTMVAGRIADRAGIRPGMNANTAARAPSSRAFDVGPDKQDSSEVRGDSWVDRKRERWERRAHRMGTRLERAARRISGVGDWVAGLAGFRSAPQPGGETARSIPADDPILPRHRRTLSFLSIVGVSVAAAIFTSGTFRPPALPEVAFFVFFCTVGATFGVLWAGRRLLPALQNETWFLRQLAAGGVAVISAILLSLPVWGPGPHGRSSPAAWVGAVAVALMLIDWNSRIRPDRRERVSLGAVINCAIVGFIVAMCADSDPAVVIAVLCGASIATQIAAPWLRAGESPSSHGQNPASSPVLSSAAPAVNTPVVADNSWTSNASENGMCVTRVNLGPLKVFTSNPAPTKPPLREPREVSFFGTIVRLPFVLFASALLFASLILAFGLAFDLPGWMASGRIEPRDVAEIRNTLQTAEWPRLLRFMMGTGMFITSVVGCIIFMLIRRARGGFHMTRTLVGACLLIWTPFLLAGPNVTWSIVPFVRMQDWVVTLDEVLNQMNSAKMLAASGAFVAALLLLLWPAPRRTAKVLNDEQKSAGASLASEPAK